MTDWMTPGQRWDYLARWADMLDDIFTQLDAERTINAMEAAWRANGCVGQV